MNNLFLLFLSLSFSGSLLALFLLAIRPLRKNRLSQTWQYYLWLIVVLRLLLPLTPQMSLPGELTQYLQPAKTPLTVTENKAQINNITDEQLAAIPQVQGESTTSAPLPEKNTSAILAAYGKEMIPFLWMPWLAVAFVRITHQAVSYRRFIQVIKCRTEKVDDEYILEIYQRELTSVKCRRQLPLYMNPQVKSPMLIGILHPIVILPALKVSDDELRQILRHELVHYKRRDILYKWIVQLVLCLHWFNPLLYLMSKEISRLCELSCDETAVKHLDLDERIIYGDALMATVKMPKNSDQPVLCLTMSEEADLVKERLDMIMKHQKKSRITNGIAVLLTALLFFGFAFTGAYAAHGNGLLAKTSKPNSSIPAEEKVGATKNSPPNNHQIIKTLDGADIRHIDIQAEVCRLQLEPSSGDSFEAVFSYPDILAANYEKHFTLSMKKENDHTIKISTQYDDQGFDPVEGLEDDFVYPAAETLIIKVPNRLYDTVKLTLTAIAEQPLDFDINTKSLEIKAFAADLSLNTDKKFDRLVLDLYAGNVDLQLKELSKTMDIDVAVGRVTLALPAEPSDVDLTISNKEMVVADDSAIYELPAAWKPSVSENTVTYLRGNGQNKIKVNNRRYGIFIINVGGMENLAGRSVFPESASSPAALASAEKAGGEKEIPKVIANINDTQYGKHSRVIVDGSNTLSIDRIDVTNDQGYACQALVFACNGTDSYTKPFHQALKQLSTAYAGHQNEITGYLDLIRENYRRNYTSDNFSAIKKVTITSTNGLPYDAYVVAICGSDEFMRPYDEFFDTLMDTYKRDY